MKRDGSPARPLVAGFTPTSGFGVWVQGFSASRAWASTDPVERSHAIGHGAPGASQRPKPLPSPPTCLGYMSPKNWRADSPTAARGRRDGNLGKRILKKCQVLSDCVKFCRPGRVPGWGFGAILGRGF